MDLEALTKENWKIYAKETVVEKFPLDSLAFFRYTLQNDFGKVQKITPSGVVYLVPGKLKEVKRELVGCYWEVDYDPNSFEIDTRFEKIIRFMPHFYEGNNNLYWQASEKYRCVVLHRLETKKGNVHDSILNY